MGYWAKIDWEMCKQDDLAISYTYAEADGTAVDVSAWDVYLKAVAAGGHSADTIAVAPGSVVKSNSGSGTVDTFTITVNENLSDVDVGRYDYDVAVDTGSEKKVQFRGTLTIRDRDTVV